MLVQRQALVLSYIDAFWLIAWVSLLGILLVLLLLLELGNTGQYNLDGRGAYPAVSRGLFEVTRAPADMGRFKPPTLRNIAVTAP